MAALIDDRFELGPRVGAGGGGSVHRGLDRRTGRAVAIKLVTGSRDRFAQEARLLAAVSHEGVVGYVHHGFIGDRRYLVMDWVEGPDLRGALSGEPLSEAEVLLLARGLSEAVACLHLAGVLHCDVKPANVILRDARFDRPVLVDLGIARRSGVGAVEGSLRTMAPEQIEGRADERSDLFGLGCVIFECLTGAPALPPGGALAGPPDLARLPGGELGRLVGEMLAFDPSARPVSAMAVWRRLAGASSVAGCALEPSDLDDELVEAPLEGRRSELSLLRGALANERATIVVTGRAGSGKSRLVAEAIAGRDAVVIRPGQPLVEAPIVVVESAERAGEIATTAPRLVLVSRCDLDVAATTIRLGPLRRGAAARLAAWCSDRFGHHGELAERAGGLPLAIVELARHRGAISPRLTEALVHQLLSLPAGLTDAYAAALAGAPLPTAFREALRARGLFDAPSAELFAAVWSTLPATRSSPAGVA